MNPSLLAPRRNVGMSSPEAFSSYETVATVLRNDLLVNNVKIGRHLVVHAQTSQPF